MNRHQKSIRNLMAALRGEAVPIMKTLPKPLLIDFSRGIISDKIITEEGCEILSLPRREHDKG
jgi:hypothetical protein